MEQKLKLLTERVGRIGTNCYLLIRGGDAVVIDPGDEAGRICARLEEEKAVPCAILLTHGHADHIMGVEDLQKSYPGLAVYAGEGEKGMFADHSLNCDLGYPDYHFSPDVWLRDREEITLAGIRIRVLSSPGHTKGSVCYELPEEKMLFSGDTIFYESWGRTDFPTGSGTDMENSLHKILTAVPEDFRVFPGHMQSTGIAHERQVHFLS